MNNKVKINRILYTLNKNIIKEKYSIIMVSTDKERFGSEMNLLDISDEDKDVVSVKYEYGTAICHMLLKKKKDSIPNLKRIFMEKEGGEYLAVKEVSIDSLEDHVILQLLLNGLGFSSADDYSVSNLTGRFYCYRPEWFEKNKDDEIEHIKTLEFHISSRYDLEFNVVTFTSKVLFIKRKLQDFKKGNPIEKYPVYIRNSATRTLKRYIPDKNSKKKDKNEEKVDNNELFLRKQIIGRKSSLNFLNIQDYDRFQTTKMGVVVDIIQKFNRKYKDIAEISFKEFDVIATEHYDNETKKRNFSSLASHYDGTVIRIVNQSSESDEKMQEFCDKIERKLKEFRENKYHPMSFMTEQGRRIAKGKHNILVLHEQAYYDKGMDEYKHYEDVIYQHVTYENFRVTDGTLNNILCELAISSDMNIGMIKAFDWQSLGMTETATFFQKIEEKIDENNTAKFVFPHYFRMDIEPDGRFSIRKIEYNFFNFEEYSEISDAFDSDEKIKWAIKLGNGRLFFIKDTSWTTLPEIFELKTRLGNNETISRSGESREELLTSVTDIRIIKDNGHTYYFVGIKGYGMNTNITRGDIVREIIEDEGRFEELLPLMSVEFVRNKQLTVIPFPFKYIREYARRYEGLKV